MSKWNKFMYILRTHSAVILTVILIILASLLIPLGIKFNTEFKQIQLLSSISILGFFTFLYKLLKIIETQDVSYRKKIIKVISENDAEQFEKSLNKAFSDIAKNGYQIYDIKEIELNRTHIFYYAKIKDY